MASSKKDDREEENVTISQRVYFKPSSSRDMQLLERAIVSLTESRRSSELMRTLIVRGWTNFLHGTTAEERSLQARAMDLPDDLIAAIDRLIPEPELFKLRERDRAALDGEGRQREAIPAPVPAPAPEIQPPPAPVVAPPPARPAVMSFPTNSLLGSIGDGGGLS